MAEGRNVPGVEGWIPDRPEHLESAVTQAVGAGSVCWEDMSGTGVFQDDQATAIVKGLMAWIEGNYVVSPRGDYTTEIGGVKLSQEQWEAVQHYRNPSMTVVNNFGGDEVPGATRLGGGL